ncbi:MAG: Aspartyl/glutamyl-tRNA(Asn/Gln) amidotransferase subunit B [Candidatus Jorgensenbacteria bacterium GW2011_GWA2_45_13]|uniref:Aspartyl/glutamyl-tRNA(Asn/Gln) amidotransferase subunit B n=1 Tax=Candidatus Jorgensenbacteria bacterium GW2011_GWA2_45_13 TaxID=1618662 RepID=A0A0G1P410_9BACT|nr:MAG: Aspartyl/glutamyl-tRNA(Asn/Gln) amidotransferase subunit B [Candidatus Jorgensenbacteria bacterium GW2011_GWA2_45_13]
MSYVPTIGLEVHAELKTKSKMFCACANDPLEIKPNVNVCPVCLAHPGAMPTINREAVESVIKFGLAVGGEIATHSHFDRKSYFYPDLPKGYQISQYEEPLVVGGKLHDVRITRVHLEEDTGRLLHELPDLPKGTKPASFVDYNRAGVPLMELVTEPDIKNGEQALLFAKELQRILRYLGVSDADMEKGQMRVEVNISLAPEGAKEYGTKVEVKNINSFKAAADSIDCEIKRQTELLENGEKVVQETRGWNDKKRTTVSQRSKESAHDYRYFPEPDLPSLTFSKEKIEELYTSLPELPEAKRRRLMREFNLSREQAEALIEDIDIANYFEAAASELRGKIAETDFSLLLNYLTSDLKGIANTEKKKISELRVSPEHLAHLVYLLQLGTLSSRLAKDLLPAMAESGEDPETLMEKLSIKKMGGDEDLLPVVREIIEKNPKAIEDYKNGKENSLQFLVGQGMAKTKGQADPERLRALFKEELKNK